MRQLLLRWPRPGQGGRTLLALLPVVLCCACGDQIAPLLLGTSAQGLVRIHGWDVLPTAQSVIKDIEIIPPRVFSEENTQLLIEARVLDDQGHVIGGLFPAIEWKGPADLGLDPPVTGLSALVTIPLQEWSDPTDLKHVYSDITAALGGVESDPIQVWVTRADFSGVEIPNLARISAPHSPRDPVGVAMLDVGIGGSNRQDVMVAMAGEAYLEDVLSLPAEEEGPEGAFFSREGSVDFLHLAPGVDGKVKVSRPESDLSEESTYIQMEKPALHDLEILLWTGVVRSNENVQAKVEGSAAMAQFILSLSRSGVEIKWTSVGEETDENYEVTGKPCEVPDPSSLPADWEPPPYESFLPQAGQVLAVFADKLPADARAFACPEGERFGVVFLDYDQAVTTTLTHELGHVFGMRWGTTDAIGHTYGLTGMDCSNAMYGADDIDCRENANHFSLGQVHRMSWDPRSRLQGPGSSGRKECQSERTTEGVCPCVITDFVWAGLHGQPLTACADYQPFLVR